MILCNVLPAWVHGYRKFLKGIECEIRTDSVEYTENVMHLYFLWKNNTTLTWRIFNVNGKCIRKCLRKNVDMAVYGSIRKFKKVTV